MERSPHAAMLDDMFSASRKDSARMLEIATALNQFFATGWSPEGRYITSHLDAIDELSTRLRLQINEIAEVMSHMAGIDNPKVEVPHEPLFGGGNNGH